MSQDGAYQLTWKGTFIEAGDKDFDDNSDLSPRASSDPGSISGSYSSHFEAEHAYVSSLSNRIAKWNSNYLATSNSEELSDAGRGCEARVNGASGQKDNAMCVSTAASSGHSDSDTKLCVGAFGQRENGTSVSTAANSGQSDLAHPEKMGAAQKMQLHRDELKVHMRQRAEFTDRSALANVLTSIQEIPEQVNEVFQQTATDLVDDVSTEVLKARQLLAGKVEDPETSTEVATQVQEIPDMVMASFEVSFAKAMSHVRVRVEDVIQTLEKSDLENDEVMQHLWSIPEEVRQIACDAVKEASVASQDKVVEQLNNVLQNISEEKKTAAVFRARQNIVHSLPQTLPETVRRSGEVAKDNVKNATDLVHEKGMGDCDYVANRVVADTLLRAKVGDTLQSEALNNPGSKGHPELCSRACLYFPLGKCTNGMDCAFCHAPHSKRSTHLDKRHREMMRAMNFLERFRLILPILTAKLDALETCDEHVKESLVVVSEALGTGSDLPVDRKRAKDCRTLQTSLRFMSARSLVALLYHSPVPATSPHSQAIIDFFDRVRPSLANGSDAPQRMFSGSCDLNSTSRMSDATSDKDDR